MATETEVPIEERIFQLLQQLGIQRAHFAGRLSRDWQGFATAHPQCVSSLTLLCPQRVDSNALRPLAPHSLVFIGDHGPTAEVVGANIAHLTDATVVTLRNYQGAVASDVLAERAEDIGAAMLDFIIFNHEHIYYEVRLHPF